MDFSTINVDVLRRLKRYTVPATYHLQKASESGNGCAGDAPGYPTYFTRSIYTQHGNNPPWKQPQMVITLDGAHYIVRGGGAWDDEGYKRLMHKLYKPLPIDHPRVRAWILNTYKHHNHCYNGFGDNMVIFPVPDYKLRKFHDEARFNDEYRASERSAVKAYNDMVIAQCAEKAIPNNHNAVHIIKRVYPSYQAELDLIENPPKHHQGDWWERESVAPKPADCPGSHGRKHGSGNWCQFCGWHEDPRT